MKSPVSRFALVRINSQQVGSPGELKQLGDFSVRSGERGPFGDHRLDPNPHVINLRDLFFVHLAHVGAGVAAANNQSFVLEPKQCFADGNAADVPKRAKTFLAEPFAAANLTERDRDRKSTRLNSSHS